VSLSEHQITLHDGDRALIREPVAIGTMQWDHAAILA
jgi:hypothetical protein